MNTSREVRPASHHFGAPSAATHSGSGGAHGRSWGVLVPGLLSGAVQAVVFNPFDRALFLRVLHRRRFLCARNWSTPFQGFGNAALYRTLCGASYLIWQDVMHDVLESSCPGMQAERPVLAQLLVGFWAGTLNGLILNKLQIVKYQLWTDSATSVGGWRNIIREMLRHGGVRVFFRGVGVSILRDSFFGMIYETMRRSSFIGELDEDRQFFRNMGAAVVAGTATAPLNYCRNMIYGSPVTGSPLRMRHLIRQLAREVSWQPSVRRRAALLNARLNVGLGALRVGLGMAVGQHVFDCLKSATMTDRKTPSHQNEQTKREVAE
jgi:hypothetical protein